jgi:hypothetical protein
MKNWKTTLAGVLALVVAVANAILNMLNGLPVDITSLLTTIVAGLGLIAAKDSNVTGGTVSQ